MGERFGEYSGCTLAGEPLKCHFDNMAEQFYETKSWQSLKSNDITSFFMFMFMRYVELSKSNSESKLPEKSKVDSLIIRIGIFF